MPIDTEAQVEWPYSSLLVDFREAYEKRGRFEIEGKALEFAWVIVNQYPEPVVTYEDAKYWISLQIPELFPP